MVKSTKNNSETNHRISHKEDSSKDKESIISRSEYPVIESCYAVTVSNKERL